MLIVWVIMDSRLSRPRVEIYCWGFELILLAKWAGGMEAIILFHQGQW